MRTFLGVLAGLLGCFAVVALILLAIWLAEERKAYRRAVGAAVAGVLLAALLLTWLIKSDDSQSGRCGDGTTRVGYHHGKSTDYVCERTPQ